ncbi:unnamed protein product [Caenorhabditis angaria]|uniref:Serpentine Receptor, class H n=1 Tax=Caenorhabditis angaria TaxID=860376 RepID=A0A9P1IW62_9PELO|nr:unnamed protein product [Caenorhabditis angaria]
MMIIPPWMSACLFGPIYDYPAIAVGLYVVFLLGSSSTIVYLLEYRMKAVVSLNNLKISKIASALKYLFFLTNFVVFGCFCNAYNDFQYQEDYKLELDKTDGPFPNFIYCNNCILYKMDSYKTLVFVLFAIFSTTIAANAGFLMAFVSYHALSSNPTIFSKRTMIIQKSFLRSLFLQLGVHFLFLVIPLIAFFPAFLLRLSMEKWQYSVHFLTILFVQHGSFSTLTMLMSNKQLRHNLNLFTQNVRRGLRLSSINESDHTMNQTSIALNIR